MGRRARWHCAARTRMAINGFLRKVGEALGRRQTEPLALPRLPSSLHEFLLKHRRGLRIIAQSDRRGIDSYRGRQADDGNREHVDVVRGSVSRVGEVVNLAVAEACNSKRMLAPLLGAAHAARVLFTLTDVFVEINPHTSAFIAGCCAWSWPVLRTSALASAHVMSLRLSAPDLIA